MGETVVDVLAIRDTGAAREARAIGERVDWERVSADAARLVVTQFGDQLVLGQR